jgi:peptide/nickel transport system ATP-binding protein
MSVAATLLAVRDLDVVYGSSERTLRAADRVSIYVSAGERVGIVGESGSGKSSVAFAISGLLRAPGRIASGSVQFDGQELVGLDEPALNEIRGARLSMIYQDPFTFLNPVLRIGDQVAEVLRAHESISRRKARTLATQFLERLGLSPGKLFVDKYPHQLSGGQRQRVVIAMAVVSKPRLVIADEPTTALDVTVQAQILRLLLGIVRDLGSSLILISHDLAVVRALCERVYVMYAGRIVESGSAEMIFGNPQHPYTQALVAASRRPSRREQPFSTIAGQPPDLRQPPAGCCFADRCPHRFEKCAESPPLAELGAGRSAACWLRIQER